MSVLFVVVYVCAESWCQSCLLLFMSAQSHGVSLVCYCLDMCRIMMSVLFVVV